MQWMDRGALLPDDEGRQPEKAPRDPIFVTKTIKEQVEEWADKRTPCEGVTCLVCGGLEQLGPRSSPGPVPVDGGHICPTCDKRGRLWVARYAFREPRVKFGPPPTGSIFQYDVPPDPKPGVKRKKPQPLGVMEKCFGCGLEGLQQYGKPGWKRVQVDGCERHLCPMCEDEKKLGNVTGQGIREFFENAKRTQNEKPARRSYVGVLKVGFDGKTDPRDLELAVRLGVEAGLLRDLAVRMGDHPADDLSQALKLIYPGALTEGCDDKITVVRIPVEILVEIDLRSLERTGHA